MILIKLELYKSLIRKFKKRKLYSSYKENICGVDLADMQLISKYNKGMKLLLLICSVNILGLFLSKMKKE